LGVFNPAEHFGDDAPALLNVSSTRLSISSLTDTFEDWAAATSKSRTFSRTRKAKLCRFPNDGLPGFRLAGLFISPHT
jgi:hypothetical protein